MEFELDDTVTIKNGGSEVYTITQVRTGGIYLLQLGNDGANIRWRKADELELVGKLKKSDDDPRFIPDRGIMD
jgi:hypothetical protein